VSGRALLVDFGGVLTGNVFSSFRAFCTGQGLPADALTQLFLEDEEALAELHALELGRLDERSFEAALARRLGVEARGLIAGLFAAAPPDGAMIAAVAAARAAGVRTVLVSNSWGPGIYERAGDALRSIDAVVLSGEVGLRKPDPQIYLLAAERAGLPADRCVLVDDLRTNVAAAARLGMATVLHRGAETTVPQLERLLGVPIRPGPCPARGAGGKGPARGEGEE
jgi:epoxide hydrolase-like predicted phosphatase